MSLFKSMEGRVESPGFYVASATIIGTFDEGILCYFPNINRFGDFWELLFSFWKSAMKHWCCRSVSAMSLCECFMFSAFYQRRQYRTATVGWKMTFYPFPSSLMKHVWFWIAFCRRQLKWQFLFYVPGASGNLVRTDVVQWRYNFFFLTIVFEILWEISQREKTLV